MYWCTCFKWNLEKRDNRQFKEVTVVYMMYIIVKLDHHVGAPKDRHNLLPPGTLSKHCTIPPQNLARVAREAFNEPPPFPPRCNLIRWETSKERSLDEPTRMNATDQQKWSPSDNHGNRSWSAPGASKAHFPLVDLNWRWSETQYHYSAWSHQAWT